MEEEEFSYKRELLAIQRKCSILVGTTYPTTVPPTVLDIEAVLAQIVSTVNAHDIDQEAKKHNLQEAEQVQLYPNPFILISNTTTWWR